MEDTMSAMLDADRSAPPGYALGSRLAARVRALRHQRGWSLERLSSVCGVSRSMLSQIERSEANPTVAVALAVATAFGISLNELVESPTQGSPLQVIRADDLHYVYRSDRDCRIRTLSPLTPERSLEFYEITFQPDGALRSAPHFVGTREHLTVQRGHLRVEAGEFAAELRRGDSIAYPADVAHAIVNIGGTTAVAYLVDVLP
jgi:transcriptional regulator with XRE-family HTH domain